MAKLKLDSPENTNLDPFAYLNKYTKPSLQTSSGKIGQQLEFVTDTKIDEGYGTLGNSNVAKDAINERLAAEETALGLIAKGTSRVISKIGIETAKLPGYIGGLTLAAGNEIFGDGKDSIQLAIDNQWLNAFESLDESIKNQIPVHISKEVQEGNLWSKMTSGGWWATQGADGVGFMLSMFLPGALTKALGAGKGIAAITEITANTKAGKLLRLASKSDDISDVYTASNVFVRNADGVTSALVNTAIEAGAEAAGTFDNEYKKLKSKVEAGEMSDSKARELAGQKAASIFKSNTALLLGSNLLEQAWIFKAFGVKPDSIISKATKDGKIDFDKLKTLNNKSLSELTLEYGKGYLKNAVKEGVFEEGLQSQLEQNISKDKEGILQATKDLFSGIFQGENDFYDNTELHEAMFLGAFLGGKMGLVGQIKENNALKRQLGGYNKDTEQITPTGRVLRKLGFKQTPTEGDGLIKLITDNWISNFKSDLSSLQTNGVLDEQKILNNQNQKELVLHALYDSAVATGDVINTNKYGQFLAYNYVKPFLGQVGMEEVFENHVKNQVVPTWKERFKNHWGKEATEKQVQEFQDEFIQSGKSAFNSWNKANETNFPERYFRPNVSPQEYAKFRQAYFNAKVQLLLDYDSIKLSKELIEESIKSFKIQLEETNDGLKPAGNNKLDFEQERLLNEYNYGTKLLDYKEGVIKQQYESLFKKQGVEQFYNEFKKVEDAQKEVEKEVQKENEDLKQQIQKEEQRLTDLKNNITESLSKEEPVVLENLQTGEDLKVNSIQEVNDISKFKWKPVNEIDKLVENPDILKEVNQITETPEPSENQFVEIGLISQTDKITTGRHVQYDSQYNDVLNQEGLPVLGTAAQQRWQNEISKIDGSYSLRVITINEIKKNKSLYEQILNETEGIVLKDTDVWSVMYSNKEPVLSNGNYVFTSISRPETIYNRKNIKVTQKFIEQQGGYENALSNYENWYYSQSDKQYSIAGITNGRPLVKKIDNKIVWNPSKSNLPKGQFEVATTGEIEINGNFVPVKKGDVYFKTNSGYVYPIRTNTLTEDKILTVIELLKLINPKTKLEDIRLSDNKHGVFYDSSKQPLIRSLINLGRNSLEIESGNKTLIINYVDKNPVRITIENLFDKESSDYKLLFDYLSTKRLNASLKSTYLPVLQDSNIVVKPFDPQQFLLNESTTTNVINKNYPDRLQKNLIIGDEIVEKVTPTTRKKFNIEPYKIYTVDSLLEEKLNSNEIKKQCI